MRALLGLAVVLALASTGCGRDEIVPDAGHAADAMVPPDGRPGPDAEPFVCSSAAGTADITAMANSGADVTYDRLYAGGVLLTGPVAPPAAGPDPGMVVMLLFSSVDPFDAERWGSCASLDVPGCGTAGLLLRIDEAVAVGDFAVTFTKTDNTGYTVDGTVTIDTYVVPFPDTPGRIAGSITGSMAGRDVSGTFDNEFCMNLVAATI